VDLQLECSAIQRLSLKNCSKLVHFQGTESGDCHCGNIIARRSLVCTGISNTEVVYRFCCTAIPLIGQGWHNSTGIQVAADTILRVTHFANSFVFVFDK
jgi:hypothetical protein